MSAMLVSTGVVIGLLAIYAYYDAHYAPAPEKVDNMPSYRLCGGISVALLATAWWWSSDKEVPSPLTSISNNPSVDIRPSYQPASSLAATHSLESSSKSPSQDRSDSQIAGRLIGAWRHTNKDGMSSTFGFESNGTFSYYVSSTNPVANYAATSGGSLYGRWSVRDGVIAVEYLGADNRITMAAMAGETARAPVIFVGGDSVQLSNIEGDPVARVYNRIR